MHLIEDLFARSESLGFVGLALAFVTTLALAVVIGREAFGLARLATIEKLHRRAAEVLASDDRKESRAIVQDLIAIAHQNPQLARARATLESHAGEIIDGADMIRLAERELMSPLDAEARRLVSLAAQRVSIVTAVSPRALIDVMFVFVASLRLVRQLARLYGGRPGALGMIRLLRLAIAHLAITGGMAASDSLVQQMLGHGIAAKLSQRLGEGMLNGLLTARLGLAAIDVTRPLPFAALPPPKLSDLATDLLRRKEDEGVAALLFPSPLVGEGGSPQSGETGEGMSPRAPHWVMCSRIGTPHPALRATFSHKGRRKKERAMRANALQTPRASTRHWNSGESFGGASSGVQPVSLSNA